jgi:toluene monooxygenase electron transfer component
MSYRIVMESGECFSVSADEDTLLRGALRAGLGFPHECSVGGCGACRFEVLSGDMETLWSEAPGLSERDRKRGKRLACQSRPRGDCTIRVRHGDNFLLPVAPRCTSVRLTEKRQLTTDMTEFTFQSEGPANFLAGQYALLYPPATPGARAYSMSNLANADGLWQFVIRRVPGGKGSNVLFDVVGVGDTLTLDGPYGHAFFRTGISREIVCIAGGSGLAPMLSIARTALQGGGSPFVHFFDGARTRDDLCGGAMLGDLLTSHENFSYAPVLSSADADDAWNGARGFVHDNVESTLRQPLDQYEFYFAGPPPMIEAVQTMLMTKHHVPYQQIHFDRFL